MELEGIYKHNDHETCNKSNYRELDTDEDDNANKARSLSQNEARAQNQRGLIGRSKCVVLSTVCFGFICVLLVTAVIVLQIKLTAERNQHATDMLQSDSRYQTEKDHLQNSFNSLSQKKLELETKVNDLTVENSHLQKNFSSLNEKKLELETTVNDLTTEKSQLQNNCSALHQKKLELETELRKLSEQATGCLFASNEDKSWSDSRKYCRDRGGDLVIIKSEKKQRCISSFTKDIVWIGLSDIENEGNMRWVDNSTLKQGFWERNEPNDAGGSEDCVELNPKKTVLNNWNDVPCSAKRKCVCEK